MFEFLKSAEVQGALQAVAVAALTGLAALIAWAFVMARQVVKAWLDSLLLKHGIQYSLNVTDGVLPGQPVPVDKIPEVVANAQRYMSEQAPARADAIQDTPSKIMARIVTEDRSPGGISASDVAATLQAPAP